MSVEDKIYREKLTLASITGRFFAFLIDEFLIALVFYIVFWEEFSSLSDNYVATIKFLESKVIYLVGLGVVYEVVFLVLYGATLGKIALKIKVISLGVLDRPSLIYALIRTISKALGRVFFYMPFFLVFLSPIQQALHDILGRTIVIKND